MQFFLEKRLTICSLWVVIGLFVYMKTQVQDAATSAGPEVYFFTALVSGYLVVIAGVLLWLQRSRMPVTSAA